MPIQSDGAELALTNAGYSLDVTMAHFHWNSDLRIIEHGCSCSCLAPGVCVDSRRDFSLCSDMHDIALSVRHERTPEMAVIVSKTGIL